MTYVHSLDELDQTGVVLSLSGSEQRALERVSGRLGVEWRGDGTVRVYPRGYVGTVALSADTVVRISTKVPVGNLLTLASLALSSMPVPASTGETLIDSADAVVDILCLLLVTELEQLVRHGLKQDCVNSRDELPFLRGRICFEDVFTRLRLALLPCEFADFLPDTPENRVLRAALELLNCVPVLPGLRARVRELLRTFSFVRFVPPTSALLGACRITRLNEHYRPAIELSRLLLEHVGLETEVANVRAPAYFFPMEIIFEKAVTNFLRRRFRNVYAQTGRSYKSLDAAPTRSLSFSADIVLGSPAQLVVDTKYAEPEILNPYGGWSFRNQHVYQIAFYALSLGCPGILAYPRVGRNLDVDSKSRASLCRS